MNTKGFTLIELMAIVIVLAAIFLVSFPNFLSIAKSDEDKKYNNMINNLCLAGESYIYNYIDDYEELAIPGSIIEIKIEELIIYGNVDNDLVNPKTNEHINDDSLNYTVLNDLSLNCEYKD